ncbi:chromosome segregation protein SMC, partial [Candidatus Micrarchaeota archaeon]|nr:chromosome segregation protein SMC [Candidatus Micrarchaeota archaeon]
HLTSASALRRTIEADKARLSSNREELARVEGEISKYIELASEKESASNHSESPEEGREEKIRGEMEILSKEVMGARSDLESLFEREKHLNSEVAELDRKILQAREQLASVRAQHPHLSSAAISNVVNQMNVKKSKTGVHGALIDLIKFDSKYSRAVEAAAGQRLRYLVVDSADVATKIISEMKKTGEGRATFIPLKEISAPRSIDSQDGLGPIFNYVKFNAKFENAAKYALGETLLVQDMSQAKKIGMGKYRMVTLDGEIFERSGVISGGRLSSGIAAASTIAKLDTELAELKNARESLFSEISNLREEMSSLRSIRAEKEVKLKSMEMELSALATESEKAKHELEEMEKKYAEASSLKEKAKSLQLRKAELEKLSADLVEKISKEEGKLANEESEAAKLNEEANKKHTELVSRISALEAKRDALVSEIKLRKSNLYKLETSIKQMQAEKATHSSKVSELERKLRSWKNQLIKKEEEVASSSKELESLFKKMKQSDEKIQEIGKQRGAISYEYEKLNKELNSINTKKTIAETKLTDLKAEFDSFQEFEYLEKSKDELMGLAKEANSFLMANPNVNLAALELYEKKKAEIGDMGDKIKKLEEEKEAILNMIKEIDGRKKETFFHMFYSINDNFKDMFKYIPNIGDGYLYLNKPADPFESGLLIKVKRGTKEIELDSLSGGEKTLIVIMFMFALQFVKPSPYYILDEADSALDKENSKNLAKLVRETSKDSQFIVVTHNDMFMTFASAVFGVSKSDGVSKIVGVKLGEKIEQEAKASG